jgi:CheY-like chemotaxis protein
VTSGTHQVLVVEDDDDIRETLVEFLEDHGYGAVGAPHGLDALEKLTHAALRPCVIILDLMMPVMDGMAFREELLRIPELSGIPVVVVSAYRDVQERAATLCAQHHLRKPLDLQEFLKIVKEHCSH